MIKLVNSSNIPDHVYRSICVDEYSRGDADYSTTDLSKPAYLIRIAKEHSNADIEVDVMSRFDTWFGTAIHAAIDKAKTTESESTEKRYFVEVLGKKLSGQVDYYDESRGLIRDYKTANIFVGRYGIKDYWVEQLNVYAYLLRKHGKPVKKLEIVAIIKDWRGSEVSKYTWYPNRIHTFDIELWDSSKTEEFIHSKIRLFEEYASKNIEDLPGCSNKEVWYNGTRLRCERYCDYASLCKHSKG